MRRIGLSLMVAALLALTARPGLAQCADCGRHAGGFGPPALLILTLKPVQEELKLTADQVKKVEEANRQTREAFEQLKGLEPGERAKKFPELLKESEKLAAGIVSADQATRLRQIIWQQEGCRAFHDPAVVAALQLSAEQKKSIKAVQRETMAEIKKLFTADERPSREAAQHTIVALRKKADARVAELLTAEQKTKWKELTGAPFSVEACWGHCR
jgi:Spy/CpxP family protein refolding chaperone